MSDDDPVIGLRAQADAMIERERQNGYTCEFVKPPDWLRAEPGCRGCKRNEDGVTYGICLLTRRYEEDKLVRFSFIALCKDCVENEDTRTRVCNIIFGAN